MKRLVIVSGLVFGLTCCYMRAQEQPAMHAPDGGTRERLESLTILPATNASFVATVTTEWTSILVDGSKQTNWNHRTVARDSSGRVFQERRFFSPRGDKEATMISELDFADPNRHEMYVCRSQERVCYVRQYNDTPSVNLMPAGQIPNGKGSIERDDLGRKTIDGVDVIGSREITTINAGVVGNEKSEPIVKEFWYSSRLGINVITKRFDPRAGIQNFVVSNISQSEPDPKMFEPPQDYRVVKMSGQ
ncbi:MAG TPA: hypothetical protein VK578_20480 [Edaphobacter sp.]|nr:hypothetical protein [Edaphobacter sp.]